MSTMAAARQIAAHPLGVKKRIKLIICIISFHQMAATSQAKAKSPTIIAAPSKRVTSLGFKRLLRRRISFSPPSRYAG